MDDSRRVRLADGSVWPAAGVELNELAWRLRYAKPSLDDAFYAAQVVDAYIHLIHRANRNKRASVVRELKRAAKEAWEYANG